MSTRMLVAVLAVLIILAGVAYWVGTHSEVAVPAAQTQSSGLANPASVNCVQTLGGTLEIADSAQGSVGYCHLQDGRVCEEWSLMRGGCTAPAQSQ